MHQSYEGKGEQTRDMSFKLLKADKRVGLYQQILNPSKRPDNGLEKPIVVGYEVVLLTWQREATFHNVTLEAGWRLPPTSQWGTYAWTLASLEKANRMYQKIIDEGLNHFIRNNEKDIVELNES